jgi:hypothetical protein
VARQIEALGITVYLAEDDPKPGIILADKVQLAIRRGKALVVLVTTTSINSAVRDARDRYRQRMRSPDHPSY